MPRKDNEIERYLTVGCPMVFHSDPACANAPRYLTTLRGWRKPSYLLVDRPKIEGRFALIRENQSCVIRFINQGAACAFDSIVMEWDNRQQNPFCRIIWPKELAVVGFRKTERVPTQIPCHFESLDECRAGVIRDISTGGCCILSEAEIPVGERLELSFTLPNGNPLSKVACIVRTTRSLRREFYIGCSFVQGQISAENEIAFFIMSGFNRGPQESPERPRILVISANEEKVLPIWNLLEQQDVEMVFTANTLDGLCRLRLTGPQILCLDQSQSDLPGMEAVKMIRATRGFEGVPVFLLNAGRETPQEELSPLGIAACFGPNENPLIIVQTLVDHLQQTAKAFKE